MPFAYFFIESQGLPGARKVTVLSNIYFCPFYSVVVSYIIFLCVYHIKIKSDCVLVELAVHVSFVHKCVCQLFVMILCCISSR